MSSSIQDSMVLLEHEGGVVVAKFNKGSFHEEKEVLSTLDKLGSIIEQREKVRMVLNLEKVEYLSSAGLGRLVALLKKAIGGGGNLFLVGLSNEIRELFDVMRLTQIFKIFSSVEDAMQAFEAETA